MIIIANADNEQEVLLMQDLFSFLFHRADVKSIGTSWAGNVERMTITTKEPKSNV